MPWASGRASTTVFDIDGIINPASTVTALHRLNDKAICYIEVGAAGNYYSAAEEDLPVTYYQQLSQAGDLGQAEPGYPEYYLNINAPSTVRIIEAMIKQQCAAKGFDAVEPDIDDSYTDSTGFGITEQENIQFDRTLGAYAHSLGLAWGQKNGDNDPEFSAGAGADDRFPARRGMQLLPDVRDRHSALRSGRETSAERGVHR